MFNESSDWERIKEKKKLFYKRMENDFDFRMSQVDNKLMILNGSGNRYVRYKTTVHDTYTNKEYEIGMYGQLKEYKSELKGY